MMKPFNSKHIRVLGIAPSSRGFGFALMEGKNVLVNWGIKVVKGGDKNSRCLANVVNLIAHYEPNVIALENTRSGGSRRGSRVQRLIQEIIALAKDERINVKQFSRKELSFGFFSEAQETKHAVAEYLAARFPEELGLRLPPKRRAWMNEDSRMHIFDAVALAYHFLRAKSARNRSSAFTA